MPSSPMRHTGAVSQGSRPSHLANFDGEIWTYSPVSDGRDSFARLDGVSGLGASERITRFRRSVAGVDATDV